MLSKTIAGTDNDIKASRLLITCAVLACLFQIVWFSLKCFSQIDFDGMSYTGIARHIRETELYSSINAFRSPLVSWLIATLSFTSTDYLHIGKLVSIATFLLCVALLYTFAWQMWHSRVAAALAALLFTLGRGLSVTAVAFVTPDFLFTALVLVYFIVLLRCARTDSSKNWIFLGGIHGLAFLAKAFALPWLGCCTAVALLLPHKSWKTKAVRLGLGALIPLILAGSWSTVLHRKYGVYTTGSQFKTNFLQWTLRAHPEHRERTYALLRDTTKELDEYTVDDPMPPGSWAWTYQVSVRQAVRKLFFAETQNVPKMLKDLTIVVTPGMLLAFIMSVTTLARKRHLYPVEWQLSGVIAAGAASLVLAYSMLVFDGRYLFPLIPLLLAVGARYLVADERLDHTTLRRICIALVVFGVCASLTYSSSPFRVQTRDFQVVAYRAGAILKNHATRQNLVSIGSGPFPEHGIGWEAGYKAAYFGGARLIATVDSLPSSSEVSILQADLGKANPDAILVWGEPSDRRYTALTRSFALQYPCTTGERIADPVLGEVGIVLFTAQ